MATLEESVNYEKNYETQMTPLKSKHWFVRHCDWWCQRITNAKSGTYWSVFNTFFWVILVVCFLQLIVENLGMPQIFWGALSIIIQPDEIYRHYRHRYFKKHHLPGPYGWGTLDKHEYNTYNLPLTTVLGLNK